MGDCIDGHRELMVAIAREALLVTKALGVRAVGFDGYDPDLYLTDDSVAIHQSPSRAPWWRRASPWG